MPKRLRRSCRALVRNYLYQGEKIDEQVHLGYHLSSTQHADLVKMGQSMVRAAPPARREAIAFISASSWRGSRSTPKEWGGMPTWIQDHVAKRVSFAWLSHQ